MDPAGKLWVTLLGELIIMIAVGKFSRKATELITGYCGFNFRHCDNRYKCRTAASNRLYALCDN